MSKLKSFLGYSWAALALPLALATFMGMGEWTQLLASTGVRVSPWYTGDVVARTVSHGAYETRIHKAVFLAFIGETPEGFVQVDWAPLAGLPAMLAEDIDYNNDGQTDFHIQGNTQTGEFTLTPNTAAVLGLEGSYRLKDAWAVRVKLKNISR